MRNCGTLPPKQEYSHVPKAKHPISLPEQQDKRELSAFAPHAQALSKRALPRRSQRSPVAPGRHSNPFGHSPVPMVSLLREHHYHLLHVTTSGLEETLVRRLVHKPHVGQLL